MNDPEAPRQPPQGCAFGMAAGLFVMMAGGVVAFGWWILTTYFPDFP